MSQITRCPACATSFRVVTDQLRIAQGWVRCGQCGKVFEAPLHLVPDSVAGPQAAACPAGEVSATEQACRLQGLELPKPEPLMPLPVPRQEPVPEQEQEQKSIDALAGVSALTTGPVPLASPLAFEEILLNPPPLDRSAAAAPASVLAETAPQSAPPDFVPATPQTGVMPSGPPLAVEAADAEECQAAAPEAGSALLTQPDAGPAPEVSFVRDARRQAFWATSLVRVALGLLAALLLAALALQWLMRHKDSLAALQPQLAPVLQALCIKVGCEIRPLRRIESLVIDSSSFSKTGPQTYRLMFVFKNIGAAALELPALEVTLTDRQDQPLVRRVLTPAQFGAAGRTLAAHSELSAAVAMRVAGEDAAGAALPVAGYRILAFYP